MELFEIIDLAIAVLGLDEDFDDEDAIEQMIFDRFEVDLETFGRIAEAMIPLTLPARSPFTNKLYQGFTRDGESWVFKKEVGVKP